MNQKELFPIFSSASMLVGRILLVTPMEFGRLEGRSINDCRIFLLVSEGSLTLQIDGRQHEMEAYSFLDLLDGVTIHIQRVSQDLKAYCLLPNYEFARESLKNLRPGPENYFLDRLYFPILHISQEENETIERQMKLLELSLCNRGHYYRQELVRGYFRSFVLEVGNIMLTHNDEIVGKVSVINKRDKIIMDFMKLVWKYSQKEHNIDFYANALCLSSKHLSRIIKETFDNTPHEVISDEILRHAMTLLEDDNISVGQIAERLCFSDQAAFCKFFKKRMKISPIAYRKQIGT